MKATIDQIGILITFALLTIVSAILLHSSIIQEQQIDQMCKAMIVTMEEQGFAEVKFGVVYGYDCHFLFGIESQGILLLKIKAPGATEWQRVILRGICENRIKYCRQEVFFRW